MYEIKRIDWWDGTHDEIDFTCPFCDGREYRNWDELTDEEKEKVKEQFCEDELCEEGEPDEQTLIDYYDDEREYFEFNCEMCVNGYLEPMYNYAYEIKHAEVTEENKKIAAECGLFLFEDEDGKWMSLMGCGMDLSPQIIKAYRLIEGFVPVRWAKEFSPDYDAGLAPEDHIANAKACLDTLEKEIANLQMIVDKIKWFLGEVKE